MNVNLGLLNYTQRCFRAQDLHILHYMYSWVLDNSDPIVNGILKIFFPVVYS